jgi:hypothetical protein
MKKDHEEKARLLQAATAYRLTCLLRFDFGRTRIRLA